ncbi:MAG TPA: D-arabinono-1,4-lactone oxidase [Acidimicrobiales bacterium]|nr:D-arabinono-1,4-lactone oxidase [Acidimicrobiales bacterium]
MTPGWRNWAGNQKGAPRQIERPASTSELADAIKRGARDTGTVRVVGSGHSFTDLAVTDGTLISLSEHRRVLRVGRVSDGETHVTVEAGMPLWRLNRDLAALGLALPNLGDIDRQTVAGAISTGTHGTGTDLGALPTFVVGFELVTADGSVVAASAEEEPEVFRCGRVALGALGVLSAVTLRCVDAFRLNVLEKPERVDDLLEEFDAEVAANKHFEFYWVPHTGWALTKRNNEVGAGEAEPERPRWRTLTDDVLLANLAFGAVCRVGKWRPSLVPRLSKALPSTGVVRYSDRSDRVFTSPRWVHFVEMEYRVPRHLTTDALRAVMDVVERRELMVSFPVEVRVSAADDIPLSMGYGAANGWVAVHMYKGVEYRPYFEAVEAAIHDLAGNEARPHWGKLHTLTAADLKPRYPEWDAFQAVRRRLDPEGVFTSPEIARVVGSV